MAARAGMANLITRLRGMTNAGTADATVGGETYWSDDHLQERLDEQRTYWQQVKLIERSEFRDGDTVHLLYEVPDAVPRQFETAATSGAFVVRDSTGGTVDASNFTVSYDAGEIEFSSDQDGADYYLYCYTYNIHAAAARVWEEKAAHVYDSVDWSSDNHRFSAAQEYKHCMEMSRKYASRGGGGIVKRWRSDMRPSRRW